MELRTGGATSLLHASLDVTDVELLSLSQVLLKNYRDVIIPSYSPLPNALEIFVGDYEPLRGGLNFS